MDEVQDISASIVSTSGSMSKKDAIVKSLSKPEVVATSVVVDESLVEPESEDDVEEVVIKDFTPARVDNFIERNDGRRD